MEKFMSRSLTEEILNIAKSHHLEEGIAKDIANTATGRVAAAALLANPVGGVHTMRGTPAITVEVPQGSTDIETQTIVSVPHSVQKSVSVPTTNFVSTRPVAAEPGTSEEHVPFHSVYEFTGSAHPAHGTPIIDGGKIKPGNQTFRVNTKTGETFKLNPLGSPQAWTQVDHTGFVPPTRDQIKERAVPGSHTHNTILRHEQIEKASVVPAKEGLPAIPSRLMAIPGTKNITSTSIENIDQVIRNITSIPNPNMPMVLPGQPTKSILAPRTDEYTDTSNMRVPFDKTSGQLKPVREPASEPSSSSSEEGTTPTTNDIIRRNSANRDSRGRLRSETSTPDPVPPVTPPTPSGLLRAVEPGKVRYGSTGRIVDVIGGVPIYGKPKLGPMLPPGRDGGPQVIVRSHYEQEADNMLSEKYKDKEEEKKLTPEQRAKKKKIADGLKKDPRFKKRFRERADEVVSRIANKMAQKNESYNPYKEKLYSLLEGKLLTESFKRDIIDAIRAHVDDPNKTISSERGDDFDILDHAGSAAESIEDHMRRRNQAGPMEIDKHEKRIKFLKRVLPDHVVDGLLKKHFG